MDHKEYSFTYLRLALLSFLAIIFELIIYSIEMSIYKIRADKFTSTQQIIHIILVSTFWLISAKYLINKSRNNYKINILKRTPGMKFPSVFIYLVLLILTIILGTFDWGGIKLVEEFRSLAPLSFIFQYIYYFFELLMCLLIISFGQIWGTLKYKNRYMPWGGLLLALTWGFSNILSGSLLYTITKILLALAYGVVFILANNNFRFTFLLLFPMFISC